MKRLVVLLVLAACSEAPPSPGSIGDVTTPVGPIPGPGEATQLTPSDYPDREADRVRGRRLFLRMNCAGCHGDHGGGGMGPSLRDRDWIYGDDPAEIFDSIAEGRAHGMPAWGTLLPPEQMWQLTAYVRSLRSPFEPEPPQ